jgi:hypothetical protein
MKFAARQERGKGSTVVGWDRQNQTIQASGKGRSLAVASIAVVV